MTTRSAKQKLCTCSRLFCKQARINSHFFDIDLKVPNFTVCGGRRELDVNSTLEFIFKKKNWPAFDDLNSLQYTVLKLHLYLLIASVFDGFIQTGH